MIDWVVLTADAAVIAYAFARWFDFGPTRPMILAAPGDDEIESPVLAASSFNPANVVYALGAAIMAVHIVCSYGIAHHWSHQAALDHTASETEAVVGIAVPHGVYVNFLFLVLYIGNTIWRYRAGGSKVRRPKWWAWTIDLFLDAIVLMATVVFETSWIRWVMIGFLLAIITREISNRWNPKKKIT